MKFHDLGSHKRRLNATPKLRRIAKAFRALEIFLLFYVLSRFSSELSLSFKFSGEWLGGVADTIVTPRFVFLVVNAIIVTLVLGAGKLSESRGEKLTDYYDEYVKKCPNAPSKAVEPPEIPQDSRTEKPEKPAPHTAEIRAGVDSVQAPQSDVVRTRSAAEEVCVQVQQQPVVDKEAVNPSAAVTRRIHVDSSSRTKPPPSKGEELTGEELRQKSEAFIERQRRFLMGAEE